MLLHTKKRLNLEKSKMFMIIFMKVPSKRLGREALLRVFNSILHGASFKIYWKKKSGVYNKVAVPSGKWKYV